MYPCADASPESSRPFVARFGLTVSRHLENFVKVSSDCLVPGLETKDGDVSEDYGT
jgi:hypothetical protein